MSTTSTRPGKGIIHQTAHHFPSADAQFDAAKLGMWIFLVTEVLFFGGLFCAYVIYRAWFPDMYAEVAAHLDWRLGALNTLVLITSSYTMVSAVRNAQLSDHKWLWRNLALTLILAGVFLVVKYFEYSSKVHHGLLPGEFFTAEGFQHNTAHIFIGLYFMMTGLHGIHVLIGMFLIGWLIIQARKQRFGAEYYTPVETVGLYWHLVDMIWIFLFPLLYLI